MLNVWGRRILRGTRLTSHVPSTPSALALVVSGDEWSARSLESMLQPAGYRARRVATAAAARERARSAGPDFIIIITPLPGENGLELCEALRRDPSITAAVPIIGVVTGALPRELYLRWLRAGAWDCLAIPLDLEQLLLRLGNYLPAKREADRLEEARLLDPATGLYKAPRLKSPV